MAGLSVTAVTNPHFFLDMRPPLACRAGVSRPSLPAAPSFISCCSTAEIAAIDLALSITARLELSTSALIAPAAAASSARLRIDPAAPVTAWAIVPDSRAVSPMVFAMSELTADCCSTATTMLSTVRRAVSIFSLTPEMPVSAASTSASVRPILVSISSIAFFTCRARARTSPATTAKPLPAAPAPAASIVALSARSRVWPAMERIRLTIAVISRAWEASSCMLPVAPATPSDTPSTARRAVAASLAIWEMDEEISEDAVETVVMLSLDAPDDEESDAMARLRLSTAVSSARARWFIRPALAESAPNSVVSPVEAASSRAALPEILSSSPRLTDARFSRWSRFLSACR